MVRIREAKNGDRADIEEIAKNTWEGQDYIAEEFSHWIDDGNFYVIQIDGKVVGTGKISLLPGKVAWLEGLRVHPAYQKQGLGRMMHNYLMQKAESLAANYLEFATHMFNKESTGMATNDGFVVVKRYFLAIRKTIYGGKIEEGEFEPSRFDWKEYIPCGWKFIKIAPGYEKAIRECGKIGVAEGNMFLYPKRSTEVTFTPEKINEECVKKIISSASAVSREKGAKIIATMVPEEKRIAVDFLKNMGFESWVNFEEPDVLVFRKTLVDKN